LSDKDINKHSFLNNKKTIIIEDKLYLDEKKSKVTSTINKINDTSKDELNNTNPFPKYTLGDDKDLYINIFKFLKYGIRKGKRLWPNYIEIIKNKQEKNNAKLNFYRKIGFLKNNKISSYVPKYIVENDILFYYKKEETNENNKPIKKYIIPYQKDIENILVECHDNSNHVGRDSTIYNIKNKNYYWINMNNYVSNYIKSCTICAKIRNIEKTKREKTKTIISHGPKDRYLSDLWVIPDDLSNNSGYKYIMEIVDHFSKFCNAFLLMSKESLEVFSKIKYFIENYGAPKYLVTNNGTEFKNKI